MHATCRSTTETGRPMGSSPPLTLWAVRYDAKLQKEHTVGHGEPPVISNPFQGRSAPNHPNEFF